MTLTKEYWQERYRDGQTGWDIGTISTPLKAYFDQLEDRSLKILIPGSGNSYEAEYLFQRDFTGVYVLDWSELALKGFRQRVPGFPEDHLIAEDFFEHKNTYDLIIEQTFFCALEPGLRVAYARQMHQLLRPGGALVGLLFDDEFDGDGPPFGGTREAYRSCFAPWFDIAIMETCYNSIEPRAQRELFIKLIPKTPDGSS